MSLLQSLQVPAAKVIENIWAHECGGSRSRYALLVMISRRDLAARHVRYSVSSIPAALCKGEVVIMRHLYHMLHLYDQNQTPMRGAKWRCYYRVPGMPECSFANDDASWWLIFGSLLYVPVIATPDFQVAV